jgi:hypothetical protein
MAEPLNYVSGEPEEIEAPDQAPRDLKGLIGQINPVIPGIVGAFGLAAATVAIVSIRRAHQQRGGHPALAELLANSRRWEHDMRHHRGALERLERALQHERRELEHHRRHAIVGLMRH